MINPELTGNHTQQKLAVIAEYLAFYSTALNNKNFELVYIDAFAGTGFLSGPTKDKDDAGLELISEHIEEVDEMPGSAVLALGVNPPIRSLFFIENKRNRFEKLEELKLKYPERNIKFLHDDANQAVVDLCNNLEWRGKNSPGHGRRAVLFLDPFGLSVEWKTLETIAQTEAIDLWYLFPTHGVLRQATKNANDIDDSKRNALNRIFGGDWWREEFYGKIRYKKTDDLLGRMIERVDETNERTANAKDVEAAFCEKLATIFPYVNSNPLRLYGHNNHHAFSLFFAVSNPNQKAITLAKTGAEHLLKNAEMRGIRSKSDLYKSAR